VNVTSASSTIASSSSGRSSNIAESKKHHNSCPGKNTIVYVLSDIDAYACLQFIVAYEYIYLVIIKCFHRTNNNFEKIKTFNINKMKAVIFIFILLLNHPCRTKLFL
jgi:hypothetical protein